MSIIFSPGNHQYRVDGKRIPGVTSILGKGIPKPALPYWSARTVAEYVADHLADADTWRGMGRAQLVAALKETPWAERDRAAARGTDVHALAERVIHGEEVEVAPELAGYVNGYVRFLDEFEVEPVLTECSVANRTHWYAGRFDAIVRIPALGDGLTLLDLKTSNSVFGETALQTTAYARAEHYVLDDDPHTEHPMPDIEWIAVAHVTDGATHLYDLGDMDAAWEEFLAAKRVADSEARRKNLIGDAVTLEGVRA